MLRKRLKNDEDGAGELEEGESSKKKTSKTDRSLVCSTLLFIGTFSTFIVHELHVDAKLTVSFHPLSVM